MSEQSQPMEEQLTVYYDASCPLCSAEIGLYQRADRAGRLNLVDVSQKSFTGDDRITRRDAMARFHVRLPDGHQTSGARGFVALWRALPSWRWLATLAYIPGAIHVMEMLYRLFLRLRPFLLRVMRLGSGGASEMTARR